MISLPQDWTCAILDSRGMPVGAGVLVRPRNVVTCTHVVKDALGIKVLSAAVPAETVWIRTFKRSERKAARVKAWRLPDDTFGDRFQDLCLLEVDEELSSATWEDLRQHEPRRDRAIRVFGYPVPIGKVSNGSLLVDEVAGGWWQVEPPTKPKAGFVPISKGFSGSLVWDRDENKAIGVVAVKAGDTTYVIPCEIVYEAFFGSPSGEPRAPGAGEVPTAPRASDASPVANLAPSRAGPSRAASSAPSVSAEPHDVFLCHASADKPAVRALARALDARGVRSWLDERELIPGRPWQEALERAIRTVKSAAILIGPSGIGPWADREMRAFLGQFVKRQVPVIPVLLPGARDQPDLPPFLAEFTWVDLRGGLTPDGLERFCWGIRGDRASSTISLDAAAATPLFKLWNVPLLPQQYQPRPELEELKNAIGSADARPIALTGRRSGLAVQGMGGVGKSVLAAALAREPEIRQAFPDGVYWLAIGQSPGELTLQLSQLFAAVSGGDRPVTFQSVAEGTLALRELLADRAILLVLDDVWDAVHIEPFNVLGQRCKLLLTTRSAEISRDLGADAHVLGTLGEADALNLLAQYAGVDPAELPPEAAALARACGDLPLALAMVGARLRGKPPSRWRSVTDSLRAADLARLQARLPDYPHASVLAAIEASFDDLPAAVRPRYLELAVFPEDTPIPEAALVTYWHPEGLGDAEVQDVLDTLVDRSLARLDGQDRIVLHDLQRDFIRARAAEHDLRLDARLVAAYRAVTPTGLHAGPDDGYFFEHIAEHLVEAEGQAALRALLLEPRWLSAKLAATDSSALLADFALLSGLDGDATMQLLRDTLRLSAHVLDRRSVELAGQLTGRLLAVTDTQPELSNFVAAAVRSTPPPALIPLWPCLENPGNALVRILEGHQGAVTAVALSADGNTAVSGSEDHTLMVWDLSSGKALQTLKGHQRSITTVAVTPDGKTAVSGSYDTTLKIWNLVSGNELRTLKGHQAPVWMVALSADGKTAVSCSIDMTIRVWDLALGKMLRTLEDAYEGLTGLIAVNADEKIAVASDHLALIVWDLASGKMLRALQCGHYGLGGVSALAVSKDGKTAVAACSRDNTVRVWDVISGKAVRTLAGFQGPIWALALSADTKTVASFSYDRTFKVSDLASGRTLLVLEGVQGLARAVAVSVDGRTAISGSDDKMVKVWDLSGGTRLRRVQGRQRAPGTLAVSADGEVMLCSNGKSLELLDPLSGATLRTLKWPQEVTSMALSADGRIGVLCSGDILRVWNLGSEKPHTLHRYQAEVLAVALSADGRIAVSGSRDDALTVWDLTSGIALYELRGHKEAVRTVAVSADGKTAVSGSRDNTLNVWDLSSGDLLLTLTGHQDSVSAVAMDRDRSTIVSGSDDATLKVWDGVSGKILRTLRGHQGWVRAAAVSEDGKTAVSGSTDNTLKVWDVDTGRVISSFTADGAITEVTLTRDGTRVFARDRRGRIHLYRLVRD